MHKTVFTGPGSATHRLSIGIPDGEEKPLYTHLCNLYPTAPERLSVIQNRDVKVKTSQTESAMFPAGTRFEAVKIPERENSWEIRMEIR